MTAPPRWNLARFDLVSVRLVVMCAQGGSLTAAAREAHLALAAASRRVRELEEAVGMPLFERHARGLTSTPAGQLFVKHGLALLQTVEQLGGELADLRLGVARHIRLCAGTAAINQFLPPLLARYAQLVPQVRVDLEEQVSQAVVTAVREGRAEVGVFVEGVEADDLATRVFRHDELVLLLPRGHRLAGRTPLPFAQALDEDWISLTSGAAMLQRQQQTAAAANRPFRLRMQVHSFDAVCHLVASGLGVAILPRAAVQPMLKGMALDWRPLADGWAQRRLLVATAPALAADAAVQALVAFLAEPSQAAKPAGRKRQ